MKDDGYDLVNIEQDNQLISFCTAYFILFYFVYFILFILYCLIKFIFFISLGRERSRSEGMEWIDIMIDYCGTTGGEDGLRDLRGWGPVPKGGRGI